MYKDKIHPLSSSPAGHYPIQSCFWACMSKGWHGRENSLQGYINTAPGEQHPTRAWGLPQSQLCAAFQARAWKGSTGNPHIIGWTCDPVFLQILQECVTGYPGETHTVACAEPRVDLQKAAGNLDKKHSMLGNTDGIGSTAQCLQFQNAQLLQLQFL